MARERTSGAPVAPVTELPFELSPQLATLVEKPRPGGWLYEIKFDGYRMLARVEGRNVRLVTRRGNDWTHRMPALHKALQEAHLPDGWYDGEVVVLDSRGLPDFNALQLAFEGVRNQEMVFYLFDAPFLDGRDMRREPVEARRAALQTVLKESQLLRFSQEIESTPTAILESACRLGLEGVIGKRRGSIYLERRSDDWIKLKCTKRQEFVIGGYTWPDDSRADAGIGALLVGYRDESGSLQYAGKVGTGYTGEMSARLRRDLDALAQRRRPFAGTTGHDNHAQWVRPELVCEVAYSEWPEGAHLRHASFKGLREDKPARTVLREKPAVDAPSDIVRTQAARSTAAPARKSPARKTVRHELLRVTHGDRVIDPTTGLTKMDLVSFYAQVAPWLLPHLKGRHVYVVRFPAGINGQRIFQQHPEGLPGFHGTDPTLWRGHEPAIKIDSVEDLVAAAQYDVIEFHSWNSTAGAIAKPDRVIFDLDPGEGVSWVQMQQAAQLVRVMLQELSIESWLKTTGGKGLHVVAPLKPEFDFPTVKGFSEAVALHLARTIPKLFVAKSGGTNRVKRIFVDYLRNGQSQSTASALSVRARPGLGVSMPITWDELPDVSGGDEWTITTALDRLRSQKRDPWAGYWRKRQSLAGAIAIINSKPVA